jgi:hypothetical protein
VEMDALIKKVVKCYGEAYNCYGIWWHPSASQNAKKWTKPKWYSINIRKWELVCDIPVLNHLQILGLPAFFTPSIFFIHFHLPSLPYHSLHQTFSTCYEWEAACFSLFWHLLQPDVVHSVVEVGESNPSIPHLHHNPSSYKFTFHSKRIWTQSNQKAVRRKG